MLGGGVPEKLRGTTDSTFYTHYSALSSVEANWGLQSLGRGDTNATLNNVFEFVANATGWKNNGISGNSSSIRTSLFPRLPLNPPRSVAYLRPSHPPRPPQHC